jgi:hypothetical protein
LTTYHCTKLDGFSLTVRGRASEKCTKASTNFHMAFTTFPQAPELGKKEKRGEIAREFALPRNCRCTTAPKWCTEA